MLQKIKEIVGSDLLQIFGDTGTGKSSFVWWLSREAMKQGKKVYFLDTERNLSWKQYKELGDSYHYTPIISEIIERVNKLPKVDLVVVDSIGLPILVRWARLSMRQKGDALLDLINILGSLKEWAYRNEGLVVVTNQPESEFGKEADYERRPFGDKGQFACKEVWRADKTYQDSSSTRCIITAFRSRELPKGREILSIYISPLGVECQFKLKEAAVATQSLTPPEKVALSEEELALVELRGEVEGQLQKLGYTEEQRSFLLLQEFGESEIDKLSLQQMQQLLNLLSQL